MEGGHGAPFNDTIAQAQAAMARSRVLLGTDGERASTGLGTQLSSVSRPRSAFSADVPHHSSPALPPSLTDFSMAQGRAPPAAAAIDSKLAAAKAAIARSQALLGTAPSEFSRPLPDSPHVNRFSRPSYSSADSYGVTTALPPTGGGPLSYGASDLAQPLWTLDGRKDAKDSFSLGASKVTDDKIESARAAIARSRALLSSRPGQENTPWLASASEHPSVGRAPPPSHAPVSSMSSWAVPGATSAGPPPAARPSARAPAARSVATSPVARSIAIQTGDSVEKRPASRMWLNATDSTPPGDGRNGARAKLLFDKHDGGTSQPLDLRAEGNDIRARVTQAQAAIERSRAVLAGANHLTPFQPSATSTFQPSATSTFQPSTTSTFQPSATSTFQPSATSTFQPSATLTSTNTASDGKMFRPRVRPEGSTYQRQEVPPPARSQAPTRGPAEERNASKTAKGGEDYKATLADQGRPSTAGEAGDVIGQLAASQSVIRKSEELLKRLRMQSDLPSRQSQAPPPPRQRSPPRRAAFDTTGVTGLRLPEVGLDSPVPTKVPRPRSILKGSTPDRRVGRVQWTANQTRFFYKDDHPGASRSPPSPW